MASPALGEKIRIEDLQHPTLTARQAELVAYANANPPVMSSEQVLARAREITGLDSFGPDDFRERLDLWMRSIDEDRELSQAGRLAVFSEAVRLAVARAYAEDDIARHPEILSVPVDRPFLLAGLPRSGTTYLLALFSADQRLRSLPYWEAVRPAAGPYIRDGIDTRHQLCEAEWVETDALNPFIKSLHEFTPDHICEDIELQGMDFGGYYIEWLALVPRWRDWQIANDQTDVYRYMRRMMQFLSWQRGPARWVTKCPQHMEKLREVTSVFDRPVTVINHRDPVASIQSAITGIAYSARYTRTRLNLAEIAEYWIDRYEKLLRACVRDRDSIDPSTSHDVYFHELMADPIGQVEQIYAKSDLEFDASTRAAIEQAVAQNKRGKHGQMVYDLRQDFGLDPAKIRERFQFYFDRFPVKIEVI